MMCITFTFRHINHVNVTIVKHCPDVMTLTSYPTFFQNIIFIDIFTTHSRTLNMEFVVLYHQIQWRIITCVGVERALIEAMLHRNKITQTIIEGDVHYISEIEWKAEELRSGDLRIYVIVSHIMKAIDRVAGQSCLLGPQHVNIDHGMCYILYTDISLYLYDHENTHYCVITYNYRSVPESSTVVYRLITNGIFVHCLYRKKRIMLTLYTRSRKCNGFMLYTYSIIRTLS